MDERQSKILQALGYITLEISKQATYKESMDLLVTRIRQTITCDCCSLYTADFRRERYWLSASSGLSQNAVGKTNLKFGEGLVGVVGKNKEILDLADATSHPNFKYLPDIGEDEFNSFLGVPVMHHGELLGVLVIQSKEKRHFDAIEESFMITLSAQIASIIAISKAKEEDQALNLKKVKGDDGTGDLAIAEAMVWHPSISLADIKIIHTDDVEIQQELFMQTLFQMQIDMDKVALKMQELSKNSAYNNYLSSYGDLLDDPTFQEDVVNQIVSKGLNASSAIKIVIEERISNAQKENDNELIRDLKDFAQILLTKLVHASNKDFELKDKVILVVESLPTAMIAELPREKIVGFVATSQSTTHHTSILAKDLGIPSVLGVNLDLSNIDGRILIVDGEKHEVYIDPPQSVIDEFEQLVNQNKEQHNLYTKEISKEVKSLDGHEIKVFLNAGLNDDKEDICNLTDGIGLYRTEINFMLTQTFPTEAMQTSWYRHILEVFKDKTVCMRTLDIGADKPLNYLSFKEANPILGYRGVRVTIDQPQILFTQLKAMLSANKDFNNLIIMIPMVSSLDEILFVKKALKQVVFELTESLGTEIKEPKFGIMVEVPSLLYMLDDIMPHIDFLSVGSNDLIQYLLAVDRTNTQVARFFDVCHPAVVRCLYYLAKKAKEANKPISLCGELAASPIGALLLLSLGYENLSMNFSGIARIKYIIRRISIDDLKKIGEKAITLTDSTKIRELYLDYAKEQGLAKIFELSKD